MTDPQTQRDQAYENGPFIEGAAAYEAAWVADAAAFRDATRCDLNVPYGDHPRAKYDMFWPEGPPRGLMIFVHGGYWKARSKSDWSHFAQGGLAQGYAVSMIGYPLAPEVRIREITSFIMHAISLIKALVSGPIVLAGHSAGGHLVARMAMPDVLPDEIAERITHIVPISPVSDLRPLLDLTLNNDLNLDAAEAEQESPVLGPARDHIKITVVVGGAERPAFLDQAQWLADAWQCDQIILPDRHHFDVIDGLRDPDSDVMRALIPA